MKFLGYTVNSNKGLIYPYTFFYIIIILTYRKIYFNLYTTGKKNLLWKINFLVKIHHNLPLSNHGLQKDWDPKIKRF